VLIPTIFQLQCPFYTVQVKLKKSPVFFLQDPEYYLLIPLFALRKDLLNSYLIKSTIACLSIYVSLNPELTL
jgi:hypothetical protein